jgi:hypothetical protein
MPLANSVWFLNRESWGSSPAPALLLLLLLLLRPLVVVVVVGVLLLLLFLSEGSIPLPPIPTMLLIPLLAGS